MPPEDVVDLLATLADPGLMAMPSGRFFGWVIGGTLPAALAADWLVSAWDQNTGLRYATPACAAIEESAAAWLLDLLGLPAGADVGCADLDQVLQPNRAARRDQPAGLPQPQPVDGVAHAARIGESRLGHPQRHVLAERETGRSPADMRLDT